MELIKKKFLQITTTGATTGCTGNCYVIIPDTGVTYCVNFLLTQNMNDLGFFNTITSDFYVQGNLDCAALSAATSGETVCQTSYNFPTGSTFPIEVNTITGTSSSRLSELKKYARSGTLNKLYYTSTTPAIDGVNTGLTTTGITYTYYIGGITYVDNVTGGTTTYTFTSSGYSDTNNFSNLPYIKDENLQNVIAKPLVDNNVFIIREEQQILDKNYRLRNIGNLTELTYYAGGAYYNIINNT